MPSKGLRRATLSTDTKLDAGDNARKPMKPLLGIADVRGWHFIIHDLCFNSIDNKKATKLIIINGK